MLRVRSCSWVHDCKSIIEHLTYGTYRLLMIVQPLVDNSISKLRESWSDLKGWQLRVWKSLDKHHVSNIYLFLISYNQMWLCFLNLSFFEFREQGERDYSERKCVKKWWIKRILKSNLSIILTLVSLFSPLIHFVSSSAYVLKNLFKQVRAIGRKWLLWFLNAIYCWFISISQLFQFLPAIFIYCF